MKAVKDYHNLYLKCDVSQLMCLSWDAMFDMTKAELDLISGAVMYQFFEKGMRGGVSNNSKRYSKAKNKYVALYD